MLGNETYKDGSVFPSPQVFRSSSNNKRVRSVASEVVEGGPAVVIEMTSIPKSKSKDEAPVEKPKTQKQLNEEINQFKCINSSCCKDRGGCFLRNFCSSDQSSILMDNAISDLALSLFKAKCTNLAAVISPTDVDSTMLFGKEDVGT